MHDVHRINVKEDIYAENDHIADHLNEDLSDQGIFVINIMGAPGVGKTTVLKGIISNLQDYKPYVIEGDIESDLDAVALRKLGIETFQINTFGACHLDAPLVHNAVRNMNLREPGVLFIENIGNLVCPAEFSIGEHCKLLISTVTEGSDKPYKYPLAFEKASIIILNKVDLIPHLDFDEEFFLAGVRALNQQAPIIKVSSKTGEGYAEAAEWIRKQAAQVALEDHHRHHGDHDHHHHDHHHQ